MSIIESMTRRNGARQEPRIQAMPERLPVSPAVAQHLEHVSNIEEQLSIAQQTIITQAQENDQLRRQLDVERRERQAAQADRDAFHTRAVASETAVNNAAAILVDEVRRGREFAAERGRPETTGGNETAVDLDKMAEQINAEARQAAE